MHPASSTGVSHSSGHSFASEEIYGGNNCIVSILRLHEFCVNDIFMKKLTKYDMLIMEAFFVIPLFNSSLKRLPFALRALFSKHVGKWLYSPLPFHIILRQSTDQFIEMDNISACTQWVQHVHYTRIWFPPASTSYPPLWQCQGFCSENRD